MIKNHILRDAINQIIPFNRSEWELLEPYLEKYNFHANEFLHKENTICNSIFFILQGTLRAYYTNHDTLEEVNLLLSSQFEFITDYESLITNSPSKLSIQAIEDSEVILIPQSILKTLYKTSNYWNSFGEIISKKVYLNCKKRTEELLFLSPEKRYNVLMKENPVFFHKYNLKHIASYLGITPQSLSRIRARKTKY